MSTPMNNEEKFVSLETLANGSAVDLFNTELSKVLENILDPNTKADAERSVTLKVTIKPSDSRALGNVAISTTSKLAPPKAATTIMYFGTKKGKAVAAERDPNQMTFDDVDQKGPQPVPNIADKKG